MITMQKYKQIEYVIMQKTGTSSLILHKILFLLNKISKYYEKNHLKIGVFTRFINYTKRIN